tara:strand:+ start:4139 stop:5665 length:1527 start_codon:yes stop_codon:yes gene_type:complete
MNIANILTNHAEYRTNHLAFIGDKKRLTYKQFNLEVNKLANALLNVGLKKGDKVASLLPNYDELWIMYWATAKIGLVSVPLSPLLRGSGLINLLNNSDATIVITNLDLVEPLQSVENDLNILPKNIWIVGNINNSNFSSYNCIVENSSIDEPPKEEIKPDDLYNIIYSSGTTGEPKGIMISHRIRSMYMTLFANYYRMTPESVVLHSGSIIFNGSFLTLMPIMFMGGTFILHPSFDVDKLVKAIKKEKVTHTILVPSQIIAALQHQEFNNKNITSLEMILSVGAPLHKKHKEELDRRFPGIFYELYGLTEGFVTILDKTEFLKKTGSVGKPPQFFEMRIVDEQGTDVSQGEVGEIIGKGPILMLGYYKDPEKTKEAIKDGWLYTGDLGYVDEDGYLFLAGRKKDLIISGGVNVYPKDIEGIILQHPKIKEVAVFGVPDERWGETPVAAIIGTKDADLIKEDIKSWINDRIQARFQKISDVYFLHDFPRNVAGKILKRSIKDMYLSQKD